MRQENGNALFMVLVGIILFAALSITALEGSQNSADLKNEEVKLAATELIDYSRNMVTGFKRMRTLNNCPIEQTDISELGTQNLNAPDDGSCDLFNENGGKVIFRPYPIWGVYADGEFIGHGPLCGNATCTELYHLNRLYHSSNPLFPIGDAERICREINYQLFDYDGFIQTKDLTRTYWNGEFAYSLFMDTPVYSGQRVFCTKEAANIVSLITILEAR